MRLILPLLIILSIIIGGCSTPTLLDAIVKNGSKNVEILFQDETNTVVLFLNEDNTGQPLLSLNTFSKEKSRYKYSIDGERAQGIDLANEYEIIKVTTVGNSSFGALWGGVFNYPNANTLSYSLRDEDGNVIFNSSVKITEKNIVFEKLPQNIFETHHSLYYMILDDKGNVIFDSKKGKVS